MNISDINDVMSVQELINFLPLGRSTIYSLLQSGALKSKKIGSKYIILKTDLLQFLNMPENSNSNNKQVG